MLIIRSLIHNYNHNYSAKKINTSIYQNKINVLSKLRLYFIKKAIIKALVTLFKKTVL